MGRDSWGPGTLEKPFNPKVCSDAELAFPANALEFMPPWEDIPEEFHGGNEFFKQWFYRNGFEDLSFHPRKENPVDGETAWRHLQVIVGTFGCDHNHKAAAVAFLSSLWFSDITWKNKA